MSDVSIPSILELNKDLEPFVIQGSAGRSRFLKDPYVPLQFVHLADVHSKLELWNRMVEFVNHYSEYIQFALHTGDYCGSSQLQYADCYGDGDACKRPIYNCLGNHDTYADEEWSKGNLVKSTKEGVHKLLFNHPDDWNVTFMPGDFSMTYYVDFPASNVRLIVLDLYYDIPEQQAWLSETLAQAEEQGLSVMTAMHEFSDALVEVPDTTFNSINFGHNFAKTPFEDILSAFIANGGKFICNLAGHMHRDIFGITAGGVLNCGVECATSWNGWCDGLRVRGTRTYDSFHVVSVDVNIGILKLICVGDNADHYLRTRQTMCYDYVNKKMIFTR